MTMDVVLELEFQTIVLHLAARDPDCDCPWCALVGLPDVKDVA